MKPHIFAQMVNEVRDLARQYGQVEQFRCRVADLLGKYIHVEHNLKGAPEQTEARAVVVPDITDERLRDLIVNSARRCGFVDYDPEDVSAGDLEILREARDDLAELFRAIPADRVLGEGMRQIDARRFARMQAEEAERPYLLELERYVRTMARLQNWSKDTTDHGPLSSLDRLRANKGGAAT